MAFAALGLVVVIGDLALGIGERIRDLLEVVIAPGHLVEGERIVRVLRAFLDFFEIGDRARVVVGFDREIRQRHVGAGRVFGVGKVLDEMQVVLAGLGFVLDILVAFAAHEVRVRDVFVIGITRDQAVELGDLRQGGFVMGTQIKRFFAVARGAVRDAKLNRGLLALDISKLGEENRFLRSFPVFF